MFLKLGNVPTVVISSPAAAELILKTHDAVFASRPKFDVVENTTNGSKGVGFAPYGPQWRNNKKFLTQELLSPAKIESFAEMRKAEIEALVMSIRAAAEGREAVDLSSEVGKLIENVTYKMLFGCSNDNDSRHDLKCIVEEIVSLEGAFNIADFIPILKPFDLQGLNKRIKALGKSIDKLFTEVINEREQDTKKGIPKSNKNIVDIMLSSQKSPSSSSHKLDFVSIKPLLFDMIVGSVDTSFTWIEWTLAEIMRHPRVMKRLQEELEAKVGLSRMVEEKDLSDLEYLEMVIKESFRLHPVATLLIPHESMEDIELDGHFIPKNTRVSINCWAIGHDPNIWSDNVEEFVPERFMNKNIDLRGRDFHLLPFGYGRRCVQWHANCNYIATGSSDKTVCLWDVQSGECVRIFIGHRSMILSLAMSPDGRYMASGDEDGKIMVWDLASGRCITPLVGHTSCVWTLDFRSKPNSLSSSLLASGSADCTVKLWDVTTSTKMPKSEENKSGSTNRLRSLKTLPTKSTPLYALRFSRRNLLFAAGAFSKSV
nr:cytochrome P450 CYP736A12-like [Ipomoea batatas]